MLKLIILTRIKRKKYYLQVALASFYENDGGSDDVVEVSQDSVEERSSSPVNIVTSKPSKPQTNKKFATVTSLNSSSSDEEGQAFYAGGSEHSGQQVLGPSKKNDFVSEMFKSVQE